MRHPTPRSGGYGTDDAPITVTTYGEGAKALIGGKTLADVFTERVDQGWVVDEGVAPATPSIDVEVETLTAGESSKLSLAGFTPGQEVTLELRPGAVNVGKVITDAQGNADVTVTMPANTAAGDYTIVATQGQKTASAALNVKAATVTPPPTTALPTTAPPATPGPDEPSGTLSTATVAAGAELTITGENFLPGSIATFTLHSDPVELGTVTVADDGTATLTTRLPSIVPAGAHTVVISGTDTSGESVEVGLALVVTAAGNSTSTATSSVSATATSSASATDKAAVSTPKNDLANTGASATLSLLVVMALLLGVGASVLLIGRRGKRA